MPIHYKPDEHAYYTIPQDNDIFPDGAEQEHKDSCDVNKMIKNALRGLDIRGSSSPQNYGYDDTTLDGLSHRIQKQKMEQILQETAKTTEFSEAEFKLIPESIKKQFGFKLKKTSKQNEQINTTQKTTNPQTTTTPKPETTPDSQKIYPIP